MIHKKQAYGFHECTKMFHYYKKPWISWISCLTYIVWLAWLCGLDCLIVYFELPGYVHCFLKNKNECYLVNLACLGCCVTCLLVSSVVLTCLNKANFNLNFSGWKNAQFEDDWHVCGVLGWLCYWLACIYCATCLHHFADLLYLFSCWKK